MSPSILDETRIALGGIKDFARSFAQPNLRLGVTGLARSGKTVFITALVHDLLHGGRLPRLSAYSGGRIARVYLEPRHAYELPRFDHEPHCEALTSTNPRRPERPRSVTELRPTPECRGQGLCSRDAVPRVLSIDILDNPGEWLLGRPLLQLTPAQRSAATIKT